MQTIEQERADLETRRNALKRRRGEVAWLLRDEHIDEEEQRDLLTERSDLTNRIQGFENELATLADADAFRMEKE